MEDAYLGEHCTECRQRDYMPIRCSACLNWYCSDHAIHDCSEKVEPGMLPREICSLCNKKRIMQCRECSDWFCPYHIHHGCLDRPKPVSVNASLNTNHKPIPVPKKKPKATANPKLQRMLVKARATGNQSIAMENRFALRFVCTDPEIEEHIFIADFQALGFAVDLIAKRTGLSLNSYRLMKEEFELNLGRTPVENAIDNGETVVLIKK